MGLLRKLRLGGWEGQAHLGILPQHHAVLSSCSKCPIPRPGLVHATPGKPGAGGYELIKKLKIPLGVLVPSTQAIQTWELTS